MIYSHVRQSFVEGFVVHALNGPSHRDDPMCPASFRALLLIGWRLRFSCQNLQPRVKMLEKTKGKR
jgi:hypothetical protein